MVKWIIIQLLLANTLVSQNIVENRFYKITLPLSAQAKPYQLNEEPLSNIESFKIVTDQKLRYILYLMSNKLEAPVSEVNTENYEDFLIDLGSIEVISVEQIDSFVKVIYRFSGESFAGVCLIGKTNDILNRFVWMVPDEKVINNLAAEISSISKSIEYKRAEW